MDDHWCFRRWTSALLHVAQPDPLHPSWISSPVCRFQDVPVPTDLAPECFTGTTAPRVHSTPRQQRRRLGPIEPGPDRRLQVCEHRTTLLNAGRDHRPDPLAPPVTRPAPRPLG